ncbi:hypothetical protein D3C87_987520 [compost metagenome]
MSKHQVTTQLLANEFAQNLQSTKPRLLTVQLLLRSLPFGKRHRLFGIEHPKFCREERTLQGSLLELLRAVFRFSFFQHLRYLAKDSFQAFQPKSFSPQRLFQHCIELRSKCSLARSTELLEHGCQFAKPLVLPKRTCRHLEKTL